MLDCGNTAEAAFIQGMAHIKSRGYRDSVRSFETVLEHDTGLPGAAENPEHDRKSFEYDEDLREQRDRGENTGIGADDVVLDIGVERCVETRIEVREDGDAMGLMWAERWVNAVDRCTAGFLRIGRATGSRRHRRARSSIRRRSPS